MDGLFETGVAVGGGWQALVAYINLGCYYIFGLPLGFLMGYALHWGVQVNFLCCCVRGFLCFFVRMHACMHNRKRERERA